MKENAMSEVGPERSVPKLNESQRDLLKRYAKKLAHGNEARMDLQFGKDITAARGMVGKGLMVVDPVAEPNYSNYLLGVQLTEEGIQHPYVQEMVAEERRRYEAFTLGEAQAAELEVRKKQVLVAALVMYIDYLQKEAGPSADHSAALELLQEAKEETKE